MSKNAVESFLRSTGGSEILIEIGRGSATFQDLEGGVLASTSTVSNRLTDGREADLIEIKHRPTDHGTQKRYVLTKLGKRVYDWAEKTDFHRKIRARRRVQRELDAKLEEFLGKVNRDRTVLVQDAKPGLSADYSQEEFEYLDTQFEKPSEEELKEATYKRMEEDLTSVNRDNDESESNDS
ncbi:hypothetical protein SAMN04487948_11043 [Halogranum amylolyticum]|uniref:Uncharacterized protein n=1 Tax=Halogranum amylolyticum TaxID=660520 RepID=A0A1H8U9Q7_9EURY|nr:hypothetical protein SAMN04487948_11043 [Halogranum amylolyticum]